MNSKHFIHLKILHQALQEAEEKPHPWKKPFLVFIGIILIVLIFTYLTPELLPYLQGRLATHEVQSDYTINLKNGERIIFNMAVYEQLRSLYLTTQTHEFKACLEGEKIGLNYVVHSLQMPKVYSESVYHVTSELCDANTIIDLHSHPPEHCIVSEQDEKSIAYFK
ncbi:MAG: hypothetical protein AABX70_05115, partial [Nanoarchaeota archaeon]